MMALLLGGVFSAILPEMPPGPVCLCVKSVLLRTGREMLRKEGMRVAAPSRSTYRQVWEGYPWPSPLHIGGGASSQSALWTGSFPLPPGNPESLEYSPSNTDCVAEGNNKNSGESHRWVPAVCLTGVQLEGEEAVLSSHFLSLFYPLTHSLTYSFIHIISTCYWASTLCQSP